MMMLHRIARRFFSTLTKKTTQQTIQNIRGTTDNFPITQHKYQYINETAKNVCSLYGCYEISTPIIESSDVFTRTLGQTSDVVSKEMYSFVDQGGNSLCLRPEGTAGIMRAIIANSTATNNQHMRYYYYGPMFRYERPQRGRMRQFSQIGIEILGEDHFMSDVEGIQMADSILYDLGASDLVQLEINTLGDSESRNKYREVLKEFLEKHKDALSPDSQARLERGSVLRILDSKSPQDKAILNDAPPIFNQLTPSSRTRFENILKHLKRLESGVEVIVNQKLVRGLDYYCHTVFEFVGKKLTEEEQTPIVDQDAHNPPLRLGIGQSTVLAGGRYDGLSQLMGSEKELPGFGWAAGVERLSLLIDDTTVPETRAPILILTVGDDEKVHEKAIELCITVRNLGFPAMMASFEKGVSTTKQLKKAKILNSKLALFIGEDELEFNEVGIKYLEKFTQITIKSDDLESVLNKFYYEPLDL